MLSAICYKIKQVLPNDQHKTWNRSSWYSYKMICINKKLAITHFNNLQKKNLAFLMIVQLHIQIHKYLIKFDKCKSFSHDVKWQKSWKIKISYIYYNICIYVNLWRCSNGVTYLSRKMVCNSFTWLLQGSIFKFVPYSSISWLSISNFVVVSVLPMTKTLHHVSPVKMTVNNYARLRITLPSHLSANHLHARFTGQVSRNQEWKTVNDHAICMVA